MIIINLSYMSGFIGGNYITFRSLVATYMMST